METPGLQVLPDIRGPLISMLLQFYTGADEPTEGDPVSIPAGLEVLAVMDLVWLFLQYVRETEREHGGDFPGFLQRAAKGAYAIDPYMADLTD